MDLNNCGNCGSKRVILNGVGFRAVIQCQKCGRLRGGFSEVAQLVEVWNKENQMTDKQKEDKIMDLTAEIWNTFSELEQTHPSDKRDLADAIHDIQKIIAVRILRRDENSRFLIKK